MNGVQPRNSTLHFSLHFASFSHCFAELHFAPARPSLKFAARRLIPTRKEDLSTSRIKTRISTSSVDQKLAGHKQLNLTPDKLKQKKKISCNLRKEVNHINSTLRFSSSRFASPVASSPLIRLPFFATMFYRAVPRSALLALRSRSVFLGCTSLPLSFSPSTPLRCAALHFAVPHSALRPCYLAPLATTQTSPAVSTEPHQKQIILP